MQLRRFLQDRRAVRAAQVAFAVLALGFVATQFAAVFTENINGDEFALLQRGERTIATGHLEGGGRPGLAVIALLPFVDDCTSSVAAVHGARLAWVAVTLALVAGLFLFLHMATRQWLAACLGTSLLVLVPVFLKFSLHVRTDQPALAAALWGGVAVLASRERRAWALVAGVLFGVGFLFTQKVIYIVGLVGLVAIGELFVERTLAWRRDLVRAAGVAIGAVGAFAAFYLIVPAYFTPKPAMSVDRAFDTFEFLRRAMGFSTYRAMLPTLAPHIIGLLLVVAATIVAGRDDRPHKRSLLIAVATMALGFAVGRFHSSAFPYFWMTLGLLFCTAIALGWPGVAAWLPRAHGPIAAVLVAWCLYHAVPERLANLVDTQVMQKASLAFVDRNFESSRRGFHPEGALFCRRDPDPIPARFNDGIQAAFGGPQRAERIARFIAEHRRRPISFIVATPRLIHYPREIFELWATHYVDYYGPVKIAGRKLAGSRGERHTFDVIVPGAYEWLVREGSRSRLSIDGAELLPGNMLVLERGNHALVLLDDVSEGMLVLAVKDPPRSTRVPFYTTDADIAFYERLERERPPARWSR